MTHPLHTNTAPTLFTLQQLQHLNTHFTPPTASVQPNHAYRPKTANVLAALLETPGLLHAGQQSSMPDQSIRDVVAAKVAAAEVVAAVDTHGGAAAQTAATAAAPKCSPHGPIAAAAPSSAAATAAAPKCGPHGTIAAAAALSPAATEYGPIAAAAPSPAAATAAAPECGPHGAIAAAAALSPAAPEYGPIAAAAAATAPECGLHGAIAAAAIAPPQKAPSAQTKTASSLHSANTQHSNARTLPSSKPYDPYAGPTGPCHHDVTPTPHPPLLKQQMHLGSIPCSEQPHEPLHGYFSRAAPTTRRTALPAMHKAKLVGPAEQ